MPYRIGQRLPAEKASRLGHLDVLNSKLVKKLCHKFENPEQAITSNSAIWETISLGVANALPIVFGIDGSMQRIESETPPHRALAFVKTALLRIDRYALSQIDRDSPHPFALKDILSDSALYHATVFPLKNVSIPDLNSYDAIRQIIFDSVKDDRLTGEPMEGSDPNCLDTKLSMLRRYFEV